MVCGITAQDQRSTDQPIIAGDGQFSRGAAFCGEHQGHDTRRRKMDMSQAVTRLIENLAEFKGDNFKVVDQAGKLFGWKGCQDAILFWVINQAW
jgi:hypothetical protein